MLTRSEIESKLKDYLSESLTLRIGDITNDSKLREDLGADSIDLIEIIIWVEDEFGLQFPDQEAENMKTVVDVINYISDKKIEPPRY